MFKIKLMHAHNIIYCTADLSNNIGHFLLCHNFLIKSKIMHKKMLMKNRRREQNIFIIFLKCKMRDRLLKLCMVIDLNKKQLQKLFIQNRSFAQLFYKSNMLKMYQHFFYFLCKKYFSIIRTISYKLRMNFPKSILSEV